MFSDEVDAAAVADTASRIGSSEINSNASQVAVAVEIAAPGAGPNGTRFAMVQGPPQLFGMRMRAATDEELAARDARRSVVKSGELQRGSRKLCREIKKMEIIHAVEAVSNAAA